MKYVKTNVCRVCPRHALRLYAPPPQLYERLEQPGEAVTTVHYPANFAFSFANYLL